MGILNVTPDSFSDGNSLETVDLAVQRAETLVRDGALIIDVGGESTRPGAAPVSESIELQRVIPVVRSLASKLPHTLISVDTSKAEVARVALDEGAGLINDVRALGDPWMSAVLADAGVPVILMHKQGDPRTMQRAPHYQNVVADLRDFFVERVAFARSRGISRNNLLLDPGFGFGKTTEHNVEILCRLKEFLGLEFPLVVGLSRKSFIGRVLGGEDTPLDPSEREDGSLAANLWAVAQGAKIVRVHNVKKTVQALTLWERVGAIKPDDKNPTPFLKEKQQPETV